jgi:hypothetical protein
MPDGRPPVDKKIKIAIVVAIVGVVGWLGWVQLRWHVLYKMKVQDIVEKKIGRFPKLEDIGSLPDKLKEGATELHIPTENLSIKMEIYGRPMGPVTFWFLFVKVSNGSTWVDYEHRIESQDQLLDDPRLPETGVTIKR